MLYASARDQTVTKGGMIIMRFMFTSSARGNPKVCDHLNESY